MPPTLSELEAIVSEQGTRIATLERQLATLISQVSLSPRKPRTKVKSPLTTLLHLRHACDSLAIGRRTFWRYWHTVFTDPRSANETHGVERKVYEDELAVAIEAGGGSRARLAVVAYRGRVGRK